MTDRKDFKTQIRARMRRTGENYTAARAALLIIKPQDDHDAVRRQRLIIDRWFTDGRLPTLPARRKVRAAVLLEVLSRFVPGKIYPEHDVSALLATVHPDFAALRRELVSFGYLERDAGRYWVCRTPPVRTARERAELPAWEEIWLPRYLASKSSTRRLAS